MAYLLWLKVTDYCVYAVQYFLDKRHHFTNLYLHEMSPTFLCNLDERITSHVLNSIMCFCVNNKTGGKFRKSGLCSQHAELITKWNTGSFISKNMMHSLQTWYKIDNRDARASLLPRREVMDLSRGAVISTCSFIPLMNGCRLEIHSSNTHDYDLFNYEHLIVPNFIDFRQHYHSLPVVGGDAKSNCTFTAKHLVFFFCTLNANI